VLFRRANLGPWCARVVDALVSVPISADKCESARAASRSDDAAVPRQAVVVAAFTPNAPSVNLGAEKKIELVLALLHKLGFQVHLVDSSHPTLRFAPPVNAQPCQVGGTPVTLWRPSAVPSRKLGKLLNIVLAQAFVERLHAIKPAFVWVYNAYSFEARAALALKRKLGCPIVLELEDLPLARRRSLNPKPWLDQRYFRPLLAATDLLTCVNAQLQQQLARPGLRSMLLPSLLQQALVDAPPKVRFTDQTRRVGYFGGLESEKGAGVLLDAVARLPAGWRMVVTGVGSCAHAFLQLQSLHPDKLEFHGRVAHEQVLALMQSCDTIVNPHASIAAMGDGVFPFKVCEALASRALLISTALPSIDIELTGSVLSFDGTTQGLLRALQDAPAFYAQNLTAVQGTREAICARFGEASVLGQLRSQLDAMLAV
jgi:glycosyltransferase involved in cell wall biosynthesis